MATLTIQTRQTSHIHTRRHFNVSVRFFQYTNILTWKASNNSYPLKSFISFVLYCFIHSDDEIYILYKATPKFDVQRRRVRACGEGAKSQIISVSICPTLIWKQISISSLSVCWFVGYFSRILLGSLYFSCFVWFGRKLWNVFGRKFVNCNQTLSLLFIVHFRLFSCFCMCAIILHTNTNTNTFSQIHPQTKWGKREREKGRERREWGAIQARYPAKWLLTTAHHLKTV